MAGHEKAIVLIGFMGAGKSSVGRALARITGWPLFDTDSFVSERLALSIAEIFALHGEEEFRRAETRALAEVCELPGIIVTGGGIVLRPENVQTMKRLGTVVYLQADEETLFDRASRRNTRPLLQTENPRVTLAHLLREREPLYREAADLTVVTTNLRQDEVAESVLRQVESISPHVT